MATTVIRFGDADDSTVAAGQFSVRRINAHTREGDCYCYVRTVDGRRFRVTRVKTRGEELWGCLAQKGDGARWYLIPRDAVLELV